VRYFAHARVLSEDSTERMVKGVLTAARPLVPGGFPVPGRVPLVARLMWINERLVESGTIGTSQIYLQSTQEPTMTLATASTTIDVRELAPRERHATIFAAVNGLDVGATLELVNDHDPKPLYAQLQAQAPGSFSWAYTQSGPEVWRVTLQKLARSHGTGGCCGGCGGA
jgi:uncharacterized protein (DUF2249 family)